MQFEGWQAGLMVALVLAAGCAGDAKSGSAAMGGSSNGGAGESAGDPGSAGTASAGAPGDEGGASHGGAAHGGASSGGTSHGGANNGGASNSGGAGVGAGTGTGGCQAEYVQPSGACSVVGECRMIDSPGLQCCWLGCAPGSRVKACKCSAAHGWECTEPDDSNSCVNEPSAGAGGEAGGP